MKNFAWPYRALGYETAGLSAGHQARADATATPGFSDGDDVDLQPGKLRRGQQSADHAAGFVVGQDIQRPGGVLRQIPRGEERSVSRMVVFTQRGADGLQLGVAEGIDLGEALVRGGRRGGHPEVLHRATM
jgi:hypothetical protein